MTLFCNAHRLNGADLIDTPFMIFFCQGPVLIMQLPMSYEKLSFSQEIKQLEDLKYL